MRSRDVLRARGASCRLGRAEAADVNAMMKTASSPRTTFAASYKNNSVCETRHGYPDDRFDIHLVAGGTRHIGLKSRVISGNCHDRMGVACRQDNCV